MDLKIDISGADVSKQTIDSYHPAVERAMEKLWSGKEDFTGWVKLPLQYDKDEVEQILVAADRIQEQCDLLIVIGIGGSYLGARAAIEALEPMPGCPEICFAGNNISGTYHAQILDKVRNKEVCLCVISKSGTTTEPNIAFAVLKDTLIKKYGVEQASKRIYVITDKEKGVLCEEADREGYVRFVVPDDVGGRYSVLTAVGLLPIAAAGIDIKAMLRGAEAMASDPSWDFNATDYAVARYALMTGDGRADGKGKQIEIFEYYEPQLQYFAEWLKQLFGESEGKQGKGLFPASLNFSADLHSMGQFLQEGNQIFFETVLDVLKPQRDVIVPQGAGALLAQKSMNSVNKAAIAGVIAAHRSIDVPIIKIDIPELTPFYFGQLIYFFEMTCAITGYLMDVTPFDQPGVERYKAEMKKELAKGSKEMVC